MGAVHQLMSASLTAAFFVGMLLSAHLFTEYRSSREMPTAVIRAAYRSSLMQAPYRYAVTERVVSANLRNGTD
jgi:hypothetical protein